jgi:pyridoxal phosphate enzyme (YggS family)
MDNLLGSSIRERYEHVLDQIAKAGIRSGHPQAPRLVVVTKSQPLEVVRAVVEAGATALGENYAEQALPKIVALDKTGVEWHMIGHVQSRKAELVAENFDLVHSLDSVKLAARLDRCCADAGRRLPVLLEVNVSGEESKNGFPAWDETRWPILLPVFGDLLNFPHLRVLGLMTMPPFYTDPERTRPYFRKMRSLREFLVRSLPDGEWKELSMGTSLDYVTAVEEGATLVRVGQAIVGPRPSALER